MATYYARNVTGNWAATSSWDTASSGGAGPAGPPIAGDTAIFDSAFTGNITIAATAACATITVQAGATGTLTYGAGQVITTTAGVTFVSGFNVAGTGTHRISGSQTVTSGGLAFPNLTIYNTSTLTLGSALTVTSVFDIGAQVTMAGAYDISCATLTCPGGGNWNISLVAGRTLTVSTAMQLANPYTAYTLTFKSTGSGAGNETNISYAGTAGNCKLFRIAFTDVDVDVAIDNWHGGTLTNTTNITNRTSADIGGSGAGAWAHRMIGGGF